MLLIVVIVAIVILIIYYSDKGKIQNTTYNSSSVVIKNEYDLSNECIGFSKLIMEELYDYKKDQENIKKESVALYLCLSIIGLYNSDIYFKIYNNTIETLKTKYKMMDIEERYNTYFNIYTKFEDKIKKNKSIYENFFNQCNIKFDPFKMLSISALFANYVSKK